MSLEPNIVFLQKQKITMNMLMKRCFSMLQMNNFELKEFLLSETEKNPLLEVHFEKSYKNSYISDFESIYYKPSLFEHLIYQARQEFKNKKEIQVAQHIIGNLDNKGFFNVDTFKFCQNLKITEQVFNTILEKIQTFHPKGLATKNIQQRLLVQIENKNSIEYFLIKNHFQDILQNKLPYVAKLLHMSASQLKAIIDKILSQNSLDPTKDFNLTNYQTITADIEIKKINNKWIVEIEENLPNISLNEKYLEILKKSDNQALKLYLFKANILMKSVLIRRKTMQKIAFFIIKNQKNFLLNESHLNMLSIKQAAKKLQLHPSTIARAIENKYIKYPNGILPIKSFFSNTFRKEKNLRSKDIILKRIIEKEDKQKPLSDTELVEKLKKQGVQITRRTVAKYRKKLLIGSSFQRKV